MTYDLFIFIILFTALGCGELKYMFLLFCDIFMNQMAD